MQANDRNAGIDGAQWIPIPRNMYGAIMGNTAPNIDRRTEFAARTDAAYIVYESIR